MPGFSRSHTILEQYRLENGDRINVRYIRVGKTPSSTILEHVREATCTVVTFALNDKENFHLAVSMLGNLEMPYILCGFKISEHLRISPIICHSVASRLGAQCYIEIDLRKPLLHYLMDEISNIT
eukprot:UN02951